MARKKDWAEEVLRNADFDSEYGVLEYALAELRASSPRVTTAAQNYVAGKVVQKFHEHYDAYRNSFAPSNPIEEARGPLDYSEYFARNRLAYSEVLAQSLDLSRGAAAVNPVDKRTAGEMLPSAFRASDVRGAMNWLGTSEIPGVLESTGKAVPRYRDNPNFNSNLPVGPDNPRTVRAGVSYRQSTGATMDEFSAGFTRAYESIHLYEPVNAKNEANNFTVWFNSDAQKGIRDYRSAERKQKAGSTPFSAFEGDGDFDPGVPGESGDSSALDTATGIGSAGRFSMPSVDPKKTGWDIDWSMGGKRRSAQSFIQDIQYKQTGKDFDTYDYNVQTGRKEVNTEYGSYGKAGVSAWLYGIDPSNARIYGIDPDSPAGKAGAREGAFFQSIRQVLESPELETYVDALSNGETTSLPLIQKDASGRLVEQVLSIQPGGMSGRGLGDKEDDTRNWIHDLAERVEPGVAVGHMSATYRRGPDGKWVYQSTGLKVSPTGGREGLYTNLYTTRDEYSTGMYQDGSWKLAPLSSAPSDNYSVPVAMPASAIRRFGDLYAQKKETWAAARGAQKKRDDIRDLVINRFRNAQENGNREFLRTHKYDDELSMELASRMPEGDIISPGTEEHETWVNAEKLIKELGDFRGSPGGAAGDASGDLDAGRTIEQFDAWASSQGRYNNPDVSGLEGARMARARRIVLGERNIAQQAQVEAVYNSLTGLNRVSAFPLGSMNEDDWTWQPKRRNFEAAPPAEDAFDSSLLGGDASTPEFENELIDLARDRTRVVTTTDLGMVYDRTTRQPLGRSFVNSITQQAALPRRKLTTVTPAFTYPGEGVEAVNARSSDPVIAARMHSGLAEDRELEGVSDEAAVDESELRFQQALANGIEDPEASGAALSARVSNVGNREGFFNADWRAFFEGVSSEDRIHKGSYWALRNEDATAAAANRELQSVYADMAVTGNKAAAIHARLGEEPGLKRYERESLRQVSEAYNLGLSWQSGKESELFDQLAGLVKSNPTGFQAVKGLFAAPGEQIQAARQWLEKSRRATPPPARDSHRNVAPVGRSMAKWSRSQMDAMTGRHSSGIDADTGSFNPEAMNLGMENTPVPAHIAARGGGSGRSPQMPGLSALQNSIAYNNFNGGQEGRLKDQVATYVDKHMPLGRQRFDVIMPYDAESDPEGEGLDMMISHADEAVRNAFGEGFNIGEMQVAPDADLPKGYARLGSYVSKTPRLNIDLDMDAVRKEAAGVRSAYDLNAIKERARYYRAMENEPEAPPPAPETTAQRSNIADEPPDAPPPNGAGANTPPPAGGNGGPPRPPVAGGDPPDDNDPPKINTDPASFPRKAPGAEGWKMTFTRNRESQTAWGRKDAGGNLQWMIRNSDTGEMEPLRSVPGYGSVWNEKNELVHKVGWSDFQRHEGMESPVATPQPERAIHQSPADFPNVPEAGMTLEHKPYGRSVFYHAAQDSDSGEYYWAERVDNKLARRSSPGWGTVRDADNNITHQVSQLDYEKHAAQSAETLPKPVPAPRWQERPAPAMRVNRPGASAAFSRFNLALNEANAIFTAGKLQNASPKDYGLNKDDREGFRRGISNEFYGIAASSWNSMAENLPASVDEAAEILAANFGLEPDQVAEAAQTFWSAAQSAPMSSGRRRLPKEAPFSRGVSRPARKIDVDMDIAARGAPGWRTLSGDLVSELDGGMFDDFQSPSLGEVWAHPYEDARGRTHMGRSMAITGKDAAGNVEMMRETATPEMFAKGEAWAKNAFNSAMSGALPSTPDAIFATVKERMYQSIQKQMMDEVNSQAQQGLSRTEAGAQGNIIKELADHASKKVQEVVKASLDETVGEVSSLAYEGTRTDTKVASLEDAKRLYEKNRNFREALGGRSVEEAFSSPEKTILFDDQDRSYQLGGGVSNAGNFQQRASGALGMFTGGSRFGSLFYGAYMLRREWQMAAAPTFQAAQKYGEGLSEYAPLLYEGQALAGTDAGFAYRQEAGEAYLGRAAYSSYGAFMDIPYRLSQSGNMSAARMLQTAGIAGGIAGGGLIGGSMLAMSGMAAAGGVLATGGLVAGGALLAGVAGMEIYNQFTPGDKEDVTPSTLFNDAIETWDRSQANRRRVSETWGATYADYLARPTRMHGKMGEQEWLERWRSEMNIVDGDAPTTEELAPWMTAEQASKYAAQDEAQDLAAKVSSIRAETLEDENAIHKALQVQKRYTGSYDTNQLMQVSRTSAMLGIGSDESLQQGAAYADQLGHIEGSADYTRAMMEYANLDSRESRAGAQYTASRVSQLGSQVQAVMGSGAEFAGLGSRLVRAYGLTSQQQVGALASMASGMQQYGAEFAPWQYDQMAAIVRDNSPVVASAIGSAMQGFMAGGASQATAMNIGGMLGSLGMSAQNASVYAQMQGGDLRAYSYQAWQSGNMGNAFFDRAGRDIMQHNGGIGMGVYNNWAPKVGMGALSTGQFLNTGNQEIISSFENGGFYGLQKLANQKSYEASMASAGIQLKGIQLQENFYWGANAGGTWDNPTAHSAWGIEDRQIALQDASQRANFADQWTRMSLSNEFSIQRENNQSARMVANNQYQNWQWSQQYNQFQQSQVWARQDWQYQDTTRGLNNAWQMEDLNEAIRFASGRERRQLVKQRDRAALSQNLEEEQVETTRDRQKEIWAQQEEQYQKQKQYMAEMQRLDQESFDINKKQREEFYKLDVAAYQRRLKEYEEEKKLSDELRELQRKFQYDQLQLSKEAAGAQAAAAAAQKEINDAIAEGQKKWEELTGTVEQMNKYNNAFRIAQATNEMMKMMDGVDTTKIDKIIAFIRTIASTSLQSDRVGGERQ